jgi:uncharacterized protein (TIGR02271 family)
MYQRSHIKEGMTVRSLDGHKLGKVYAIGETEFHIEKGLFFPKDYSCRFSEISDIRDGDIILAHGRDSLHRLSLDSPYVASGTSPGVGTSAFNATGLGAPQYTAPNLGTADTSVSRTGGPGLGMEAETDLVPSGGWGEQLPSPQPLEAQREVTIPLHKEELDITRRSVEAGAVRVHKDIVEEEQVVAVPIRKERVRVERHNVDRPAMQASFQEETVVVPVRTEEVEAHKRAVVDEEVIIRKDVVEEERHIHETLRREEVDIRDEGHSEGPRAYTFASDDPLERS